MTGRIPPRFQTAVERFTARWKRNPNVIGIYACGSAVRGQADKNSDIDIQIVLKDSDYRERGNTWFDDVEVEYFINPVRQVRSYLKKETSAATARMLTDGVILYEKGPVLRALIREAHAVLKTPPAPMTAVQRELAKYTIDDLKNDLEDVHVREDRTAYGLIATQLIDECVKAFCARKRVRKEKPKRLEKQLQTIDKEFARRFRKAVTNGTYHDLTALARYTETLLGGARKREWKLRGKLDV